MAIRKIPPEVARARYERYKPKMQQYYIDNRERIRAVQKAYVEKNKEKIRAQQKNPKYRLERKEWYQRNREQMREYQRRYYLEVTKPKRRSESKVEEV